MSGSAPDAGPSGLVSPEAREWVRISETARAGDPSDLGLHLMRRREALRVLDPELTSARRLGPGAMAWALGVAAGAGLTAGAWSGGAPPVRLGGLVLGVLLAGAAVVLGLRVRAAGRRVVEAFCWWSALPRLVAHAEGRVTDWGESDARAAVEARACYLHPRRYVAAGLAAAGGLAPLVLLRMTTDPEGRWADAWPTRTQRCSSRSSVWRCRAGTRPPLSSGAPRAPARRRRRRIQ